MSVPNKQLMIKALFIAVAFAASGGAATVYAQASTPSPSSSSSTDGSTTAAPAGGASRNSLAGSKKSDDVEVRREELGKKLLKRKTELDNDRPNPQPTTAPGRAQEPQADHKGQKK